MTQSTVNVHYYAEASEVFLDVTSIHIEDGFFHINTDMETTSIPVHIIKRITTVYKLDKVD